MRGWGYAAGGGAATYGNAGRREACANARAAWQVEEEESRQAVGCGVVSPILRALLESRVAGWWRHARWKASVRYMRVFMSPAFR